MQFGVNQTKNMAARGKLLIFPKWPLTEWICWFWEIYCGTNIQTHSYHLEWIGPKTWSPEPKPHLWGTFVPLKKKKNFSPFHDPRVIFRPCCFFHIGDHKHMFWVTKLKTIESKNDPWVMECVLACFSQKYHIFFKSPQCSQMKSELHKTFRIGQGWSPAPSKNVGEHAHAHMHAQWAETCMQLSDVFGRFWWNSDKSGKFLTNFYEITIFLWNYNNF